jgi:lysophospholipase L1-like esterase
MSTSEKKAPVDRLPLAATRARAVLKAAAYGGGLLATAGAVTAGVLFSQVELAKRIIPLAEAPPPRADGRYGQRFAGKPITLVVLGDSTAAGFGVHRPRETPLALLANGLARRLQRPVTARTFAVVGATSEQLVPQVEVALDEHPDLAIIIVGANDITHNVNRSTAVRYLADAVRRLHAQGAEVVVATCPDLGTIQPIYPPLRWLAGYWSRQLAAEQTVAVVEAGGRTVSLGDLLGQRFVREPQKFFGVDKFHPSADGYAVAVAAILPTAIATMRPVSAAFPRDEVVAAQIPPAEVPSLPKATGFGFGPRPAARSTVRSLPEAAAAAARRPGTEVSGVSVGGRERGPGGRWAQLRHRMWEVLHLPENPAPADPQLRWPAPEGTKAVEGQPT